MEGTLGLVELMKKKETEKFADPKPHMYFPPRGTPVVDPTSITVLNPKLTKFEENYYKAMKVAVSRKKIKILKFHVFQQILVQVQIVQLFNIELTAKLIKI